MLHPAPGTLGNAIGGELFGQRGILQVGELVAESYAVIIETHHQTGVLAQRRYVFVGLVAALQAFAA